MLPPGCLWRKADFGASALGATLPIWMGSSQLRDRPSLRDQKPHDCRHLAKLAMKKLIFGQSNRRSFAYRNTLLAKICACSLVDHHW
jgi:hypothetical protein